MFYTRPSHSTCFFRTSNPKWICQHLAPSYKKGAFPPFATSGKRQKSLVWLLHPGSSISLSLLTPGFIAARLYPSGIGILYVIPCIEILVFWKLFQPGTRPFSLKSKGFFISLCSPHRNIETVFMSLTMKVETNVFYSK